MVTFIEDNMKKKLDENRLKEIILNENKSIEYYKNYLEILKTKYFPNTLTTEMFKVFATHPWNGKRGFFKVFWDVIRRYKKFIQWKKLKIEFFGYT